MLIRTLKERSVTTETRSARFAPDRGVCVSCGETLPFSMTVPLVAKLNKCSECYKLTWYVGVDNSQEKMLDMSPIF